MFKVIVLAVPENYESIGGLYLPISEYIKMFSQYYDVRILKMPYRYNIQEYNKYRRIIGTIITENEVKAILAYGLNVSYAISKILDKRCRAMLVSLTRDSLYFGTLFSLLMGKTINANSIKRILRLIPYRMKEKYLTRNCKCMVYASKWDADKVSNGYGKIKADIITVPNGIHVTDFFTNKKHDFEKEIVLGFIGYWTVDYMDECIYPMLSICEAINNKNEIKVKLILAGRNISNSQKNVLSKYEFVKVLGAVEQLDEFYNSIDIFISTVKKKNGILNKVLEAFSYKKCVIGFEDNFYAIEGCVNGENCLIANTNEEFEAMLYHIKNGKINPDTIGVNAYKLIQVHYSWDSILLPLYEYIGKV
ncbi:glycosyltransferase [Clostridiaceae bacterium]|nr:glycosyltransferase [Clostridiaceae bacterium]RKI09964.1 glycosyltransferase [bacterium 1XD21-70]